MAGVSCCPTTVNFFTNHGPAYGGDHNVFAATAPPTTTPANAVTEAPPRSRLRRVAVVCLLLALVAIVCAALALAHPRTALIWQVGSQVFTAAGGLVSLVGVALTIGSLDRRREGRR
ncbi:hypothetical protein [Streptomyces sp. x-19]|uniref:hypothetical protein n=1 Tax=Streptomyces sp. x-19 TaxID=2789280 RepID=UPI0039817BEE